MRIGQIHVSWPTSHGGAKAPAAAVSVRRRLLEGVQEYRLWLLMLPTTTATTVVGAEVRREPRWSWPEGRGPSLQTITRRINIQLALIWRRDKKMHNSASGVVVPVAVERWQLASGMTQDERGFLKTTPSRILHGRDRFTSGSRLVMTIRKRTRINYWGGGRRDAELATLWPGRSLPRERVCYLIVVVEYK